ncbi:hypothetical protein MRX96_015705 [Rhipicephalus microplus]
MATRQRRSNTTGQGRRRHQCQQARQQQRADYQAQPTNGQEDEGNQRGIRDEVPVGVMAGPFMGPFVAQPLYYIPSTTQVYQPVIFQQEPILPVGQGDGASATQEYIRLMEGALRWSQHRSQRRGQRPLWGTGEPHEGSRDNPTPHAVGTEEGDGDAPQSPTVSELAAILWRASSTSIIGMLTSKAANPVPVRRPGTS